MLNTAGGAGTGTVAPAVAGPAVEAEPGALMSGPAAAGRSPAESGSLELGEVDGWASAGVQISGWATAEWRGSECDGESSGAGSSEPEG